MKTISFLQTHKNLQQIHRLVHRIKGESPAARIVISQNEAQFRTSQDARIDDRVIAERPTLAPGASECVPSR